MEAALEEAVVLETEERAEAVPPRIQAENLAQLPRLPVEDRTAPEAVIGGYEDVRASADLRRRARLAGRRSAGGREGVPVRLPYPVADHQGSIYENQKGSGRRQFETFEQKRAST